MDTDWISLEDLIRDAVTGKLRDPEGAFDIFQAARAEDHERYKEVSERIKKEEQDRLRRCFNG